MEFEFEKELNDLGVPKDIIHEFKLNGIFSKEEFFRTFKEREALQTLVNDSNDKRAAKNRARWTNQLVQYHSRVADAFKKFEQNQMTREIANAKKNRITVERLNQLEKTYQDETGKVILDYVRPDAELIGTLEQSFLCGKFAWAH